MKKSVIWILFLVALGIRVIYTVAVPDVYYNVDSLGYYSLGLEMLHHPGLHSIFTPFRTPLYPLFFNVVLYVTGFGGSIFASPPFTRGIQYVAGVQMLVGAAVFAVWCRSFMRLVPRRAGYIMGVFLLLDVLVIGWERTMLTEGLAISLLMLATSVLIQILFKPNAGNFLVLLSLFILGFLLRPAFLIVPIVCLPVIGWYFRKQAKVVFLAMVTLAAFLITPIVYAQVNYSGYGYSGIQYVGDIDVLGRILESRVPVDSAKSVPYYYKTATDYVAKGGDPQPFRFLESYDADIYSKPYRLNEIGKFNFLVVTHTLPQFITSGLRNIPEVLLEVCDFIKVPRGSGFLADAVWYMQQLYASVQYVTIIIPIVWVVCIVLFLVKPTRWRTFIVLLGTIALSQILMTSFFVYKDIGAQYGRVLSAVRPQMFLFLMCCGFWIVGRRE